MPSESDLRDSFRAAASPPDGIDIDDVVRRARARRRPRVALATGIGALALVAVLTPAIATTSLHLAGRDADILSAPESAADSDGDSAGGSDAIMVAPADRLNFCGAPPAEVAPAANGLVLELESLVADSRVSSIPVQVTLRNTGTERVTGTTAGAPALTLLRDNVVIWHTNGPATTIVVEVDLDPGESIVYDTWFSPVVCGPEDDGAGFRPDLPAAGPGEYTLSAAIDFAPESGDLVGALVTGPPVTVRLR